MELFVGKLMELGPIPGLPAVINYAPHHKQTCRIEQFDGEICFIQTAGDQVDFVEEPNTWGNPYSLRDALENVETPEQARQFLEACGPWLPPDPNNFPEGAAEDWQLIRWEDFQRWQMYFRDRRQGYQSQHPSTGRWSLILGSSVKIGVLRGEIRGYGIHPSGIGIHFHLAVWFECNCALEAISAVVELEQTLGIQYRVCAWAKCQQLFRLGHRTDKLCCNDDHAHANGQRRRRKNKRAMSSQEGAPQ